jgi:glycine cleavage system H lipoate-binding protein
LVNSDPYGDADLLRSRVSDPATIDGLMDATAYEGQLG